MMIKKPPQICVSYFDVLHFLNFFLKHVSQIISIFLEGVQALYNSQLNLRCPQSLYLRETMSGKQKNLYQMTNLLHCPQ